MRRLLLRLIAAAALLAPAFVAAAFEESSLLTSDGTLHTVQAGTAAELGVSGQGSPDDAVIEWSSRRQDGSTSVALIPGTDPSAKKRGLRLAFDEQTQTLLLLWTEDYSPYSQIRLGVLRAGVWTNSGLLPSQGISKALNPQMLITHQSVFHLDENDQVVHTTSSTLSIIWWEEAQVGQARFATLALDENQFDPKDLAIYDMPVLLGTSGPVSYEGIPSGSYLYPALQADGLSGGLVAVFADLHDQLEKVVKISFPEDQGKPSDSTSVNWKRRHIPIVGVASQGPIARTIPSVELDASADLAVGTSVGSGYKPTHYWRADNALDYTRLEGADWAPVRAIPIDDVMTWERATALVVGMGQRN
jgi:hypothetical protein